MKIMVRAPVNPTLVSWALDRADVNREKFIVRFPKILDWEEGVTQPTLKQLRLFARAVHVPIGYLFLPEPPQETVPIPDFRTVGNQAVTRPSPNLLDTVYACQARQSWYREYAELEKQPALSFVGSLTTDVPPDVAASKICEFVGFTLEARSSCSNWEDSLRLFVRQADAAGVLVMVNGVVGNNTHRRLNPEEFRGFALSDELAPLIFVNGADAKAAQIFTLAHELAHLWLGDSALSSIGAFPQSCTRQQEIWCNAVAAEMLVPLSSIQLELKDEEPLSETLQRLGNIYKVSSLVILRRLLDVGYVDRTIFDKEWKTRLANLQSRARSDGTGGGDFYKTVFVRSSNRFTRALVASTLEGYTLHRDAFRMLGISKTRTFHMIANELE